MNMTVTFTNEFQKVDYQLERKMKIKDILLLLYRNDNFQYDHLAGYIYAERLHQSLSVELTFEQAKIYSGDIITVAKKEKN